MTELLHNGDLQGLDAPPRVLARRRTPWQLVEIVHHPVYGAQLLIDHDLQISESDFAYNAAMTAPLLTLDECRRVAILGGGDGGVLNEVIRSCERTGKPLESVTLVDIDGEVMHLCEQYMPTFCGNAFRHPLARIHQGDALAWIGEARDLDAVIYDLTMEPVRDDTTRGEFIAGILSNINDSLRPGGVISLQAFGEWQTDRDVLREELYSGLDRCFSDRTVQQVIIPSYGELWTFMSARKPDRPPRT
jgi:spermidine synthase